MSTTYAPGELSVVTAEGAALLLAVPPSDARARACWDIVERGGGADDLVDSLLADGWRSVPDFALVTWGNASRGTGCLVMLRGEAGVSLTAQDGSTTQLSGRHVRTWVEQSIDPPPASVELWHGSASDGPWLPLVAGVVPAAAVHVEPGGAIDASTESAPAAAAAAEPAAAESAVSEPPADEVPSIPEPVVVDEPEPGPSPAPEPAPAPVTEPEFAAEPEPESEPRTGPDPDALARADQAASAAWGGPPPAAEPSSTELPHERLPHEPLPPDPLPTAPPESVPGGPPAVDPTAMIESVPWATGPEQSEPAESGGPGDAVQAGGPPPGLPEVDPDAPTLDRASVAGMLDQPADAYAAGPTVQAALCPYGHLTPPYDPYCRVCGTPVPPQEPVVTARPVLGILRLSTGDVVPLDRGVLLGRSPRVDNEADPSRPHVVRLPSPANDISRSHVEVRLDDWMVLVIDLGSTNGTTVTIPGQAPIRLRPNDPLPMEPNTEVNLADEVVFRFEVVE